MILHEAEAKRSVNIKDILRMQVGFNCLLSHKGITLLMLPMTYKGINKLLLMHINTSWLDAHVNSQAFEVYGLGDVRYNPAKPFEVWLQWDRSSY